MNKRLLLIEDNETLRELYSQCLQNLNLNIQIAVDGAEALNKISHENYDLYIVDIFLPDKNGLEIIRAIKKKDAKANILVISAAATDSIVNMAMEIGATAILKKPFELNEIREVVKRYI